MAEHWQPGDLARCVDVRDLRLPLRPIVAQGGQFLKLGMVYIVRSVGLVYQTEPSLDVGAKYGSKLACRFVKVPPVEEEGAEAAAERELADG